MNRRFLRTILPLAFLVIGAILFYYKGSKGGNTNIETVDFNRNLTPIIYTKHARCRMGCRNIDEEEIKQILYNGKINYSKSEPNGKPDPKYALEGYTKDNQHLRIIFAPSKRGMVVITCIDINVEWKCDCN